MNIIIRSFGLPKEVLESDWFEVELPEHSTVGDLSQLMTERYPELYGLRSLALYVNGHNVTDEVELHDGDQAFFAPVVAGG